MAGFPRTARAAGLRVSCCPTVYHVLTCRTSPRHRVSPGTSTAVNPSACQSGMPIVRDGRDRVVVVACATNCEGPQVLTVLILSRSSSPVSMRKTAQHSLAMHSVDGMGHKSFRAWSIRLRIPHTNNRAYRSTRAHHSADETMPSGRFPAACRCFRTVDKSRVQK